MEDYQAVAPSAAVTSPKVGNFSISVAVVSTVVAAVVAAWNVVVYQRLRRSCISDSVAHVSATPSLMECSSVSTVAKQ